MIQPYTGRGFKLKEPVQTADALTMAWHDNWLAYVIGVLAVAIVMFVWADTRSDIEGGKQVHENVPAETQR